MSNLETRLFINGGHCGGESLIEIFRTGGVNLSDNLIKDWIDNFVGLPIRGKNELRGTWGDLNAYLPSCPRNLP
jgi:hypothetical protein